MRTFSELLKMQIETAGLSDEEARKRSGIVTRTFVEYLQGVRIPRFDLACTILKRLGLDVLEKLGKDATPEKID